MNNQTLTKLSILPTNKTVVFYSPIEGQDVLVRTGTIGDDSPFLHALLHANSKEYIKMDKKGKMKIVEKLRKTMSDKLEKKRWEEVSSSMVAKIPFQENVNKILNDFYRHINGSSCKSTSGKKIVQKISKDLETYKIICELVTLDNFQKDILPKAYDTCSDEKLEKCKEEIIQATSNFSQKIFDSLGNNIEKARKKFCIDKITTLVSQILNEADEKAYKKYIENLKDLSVSVDSYTIELLSNRFNRNIYFMDSLTRMPYKIDNTKHNKHKKSIILMWLGGVHYETVGKLLPHNRIQREFYNDDPLIRRIDTFLYKPNLIPEQYPNLIPYLPQKEKTTLKLHSKQSQKSSRSHSSDSSTSSESSRSKSSKSSRSKSSHTSRSKSSKSSRSKSSHTSRSKSSKSSRSS